MLTNFGTIRRAIKKMASIDRMKTDGTFDHISKRERLQIMRQRDKMEKNLGSIADLTRLPSALFIVDLMIASLNEGLEERKSDKERGEAVPVEGEETESAEEGVAEAGTTEPK